MKNTAEKMDCKIAISSNEKYMTPYFGHCYSFDIVEVKDGKIAKREQVLNPGYDTDFLPKFLFKKGISHVMAGHIDQEMKASLNNNNIKLLLGISGEIDDVIEKFVNGNLKWRF